MTRCRSRSRYARAGPPGPPAPAGSGRPQQRAGRRARHAATRIGRVGYSPGRADAAISLRLPDSGRRRARLTATTARVLDPALRSWSRTPPPRKAAPMSTLTIEAGRARIDSIDDEIVRLVRERIALSQQVQQVRRAVGGPRVVQARENDVVGRWRAQLGRPGGAIALALLELGRGPSA
ncbi:MAG: chorismate mutase [Mycobacteriales bacterium]